MDSEKIENQIKILEHKRVVIDSKISRLKSSLSTGITNVKKTKVIRREKKEIESEQKDDKKEEKSSFFGF